MSLGAAVTVAACTTSSSTPTETTEKSSEAMTSTNKLPRNYMPVRRGDSPPQTQAPFAGKLNYYGGHVMSNVKVIAVNWGPNVDNGVKTKIGDFYTAVTNSAYMDWLGEYDTVGKNGLADGQPGSNQRVGRGSFGGSVTITPGNASTSISDTAIQTELKAQIAANKLPAPEFDATGSTNTIYMIDFPPGLTITGPGGSGSSCTQFCAYHGAMTLNGKTIPYGVHPDMSPSSPCTGGCGRDANYFNNVTSVHSHELIEAITDPEIGIFIANGGTSLGRPVAWYNPSPSTGEIGDICNAQQGTIAGYTVQLEWSNAKNACILTVPGLAICDGVTRPCRPCTAADNGAAGGCTGAKPVCETDATNLKIGQCVACTSKTNCSAPTPICEKSTDPSDDTCIGCQANADCSGGTPICEKTTKTCRACTGNADCTSGVCALGASDPKKGQCVQCTGDSDCTAPTVCDTKQDTCVQCTTNAQCANPKPVCDTSESCRNCTQDSECAGSAGGPFCATIGATIGSCVACGTNADCKDPAKNSCDATTHVCTACTGSNCGIHVGADGGPSTDPVADTGTSSGCSMSKTGTTTGGAGLAGLLLGLVAFARRLRKSSN